VSAVQEPGALDWNARWRAAVASKWPGRENNASYWNRRAPSFPRHGEDSTYARAVLELLAPQPDWTVLDVGCGTGALAVPLAGLVRSVTAMDFAQAMLDQLQREALSLGIGNIRPLHLGWEDDWPSAGVTPHDVALASRSLVVEDLEGSMRKLDAHARRRVCIGAPVGPGPFDRHALAAVGRSFQQRPDYLYVYNLLHQMGIYAQVKVIEVDDEWTFTSPEEALGFYRMRIPGLDPGEDLRLRAYLDGQLELCRGTWVLRGREPIRWALVWWDK